MRDWSSPYAPFEMDPVDAGNEDESPLQEAVTRPMRLGFGGDLFGGTGDLFGDAFGAPPPRNATPAQGTVGGNGFNSTVPGAPRGTPVSPAMRDTPDGLNGQAAQANGQAGNPYSLAQSMLGRGEITHREAIKDYLQTGGANLDPATAAWCAAFVNASLGQAGMKGTGSNMARSFLNWGTAVQDPREGDVAVFSRGDPNSPYGHVGFYAGRNPDGTIRVLGGNQGNKVSYANYPAWRLLGFRRAG